MVKSETSTMSPQLTILSANYPDTIVLDLDRTGSLRDRRLLINTTTGLDKQAALRSSYKHHRILTPERQPFPLPKGVGDQRHARDIRISRRSLIPLKIIGCVRLTYSRNIRWGCRIALRDATVEDSDEIGYLRRDQHRHRTCVENRSASSSYFSESA